MQKYLILDLGNVLVHVDFEKFYTRIKSVVGYNYNETMKKMAPLMSEYNKGSYTAENFYKQVCRLLKLNVDFNFFSKAWVDIFEPNKELLTYLGTLKKEHLTIILASNTDPLHFEFVKKKYGFKFVDSLYLSYKEQLIKPDPAFFQQLIAKMDINPDHAIFFDDLPENVKSAQDCGIRALVHANNADTISAISEFCKTGA